MRPSRSFLRTWRVSLMPGSANLFDSQWLTDQNSESDPRRYPVGYLQIHHAATTSTTGARSLMDPGGRTVSSNGLLAPDGHLYEVVLLNRRAYTSATTFDHYSLTVETVNTSGANTWGISEASRLRLAKLAVDMFRAGLLGSLTRAHIIGHNEVPGTYATACPGPDMLLDHIVQLAQQLFAGGTAPAPKRRRIKVAAALVFDKDRGPNDGTSYSYDTSKPNAPLKVIGYGDLAAIQAQGVDAAGIPRAALHELFRERGTYVQDGYKRLTAFSDAAVSAHMAANKVGDRTAYTNYDGFLVFRPN